MALEVSKTNVDPKMFKNWIFTIQTYSRLIGQLFYKGQNVDEIFSKVRRRC